MWQCDAEMSDSIELAILHWKVFDAMKEKPKNNNEMLNYGFIHRSGVKLPPLRVWRFRFWKAHMARAYHAICVKYESSQMTI